MKPRPRDVEREAAKRLSRFLSLYGCGPVERVPVLGRTGPDLTIDPNTKLVVDVKSRIRVPQSYMLKKGERAIFGEHLTGVRLGELERMFECVPTIHWKPGSVDVERWFAHMAEWTRENCPEGIPMLILHRPKMRIENSTAVIYLKDRSVLRDRCNKP